MKEKLGNLKSNFQCVTIFPANSGFDLSPAIKYLAVKQRMLKFPRAPASDVTNNSPDSANVVHNYKCREKKEVKLALPKGERSRHLAKAEMFGA